MAKMEKLYKIVFIILLFYYIITLKHADTALIVFEVPPPFSLTHSLTQNGARSLAGTGYAGTGTGYAGCAGRGTAG